MVLWTDKTAAEATGGKAQGSWQASRVEIDSRKIQPGDLFIALKGDNFDGHEFVEAALAKGAVAAVVSTFPSPGRGEGADPALVAGEAGGGKFSQQSPSPALPPAG